MRRASVHPVLLLSLLFPAAAAAQSSLTGTWITDAFGAVPNLIDLEVNGSAVTGTISRNEDVYSIYDGRVTADVATFKIFAAGGGRTISFTGRLNNDVLSFTRSVQILPGGVSAGAGIFGATGPMEFEAKRETFAGSRIPRAMLGNWRLNLQRSTFQPGPAPRPMIADVASVAAQPGGWFSSINVGVNANGTPFFGISAMKADGREYPQENGGTMSALLTSTTASPLTISVAPIDARTLEFTSRSEGTITSTNRMVLSQNGDTVTATVRHVNREGEVTATNTVVWDRLTPTVLASGGSSR